MFNKRLLILLILFSLAISSAGCNNHEESFELTEFTSNAREYPDTIQLEFQYDITNYSDDDHYVSFVFPSYIQNALITPVGPTLIPAGSTSSSGLTVGVSKDGAEMSDKTIEAILNGELPYFEEMVVGKVVSLEETKEEN